MRLPSSMEYRDSVWSENELVNQELLWLRHVDSLGTQRKGATNLVTNLNPVYSHKHVTVSWTTYTLRMWLHSDIWCPCSDSKMCAFLQLQLPSIKYGIGRQCFACYFCIIILLFCAHWCVSLCCHTSWEHVTINGVKGRKHNVWYPQTNVILMSGAETLQCFNSWNNPS